MAMETENVMFIHEGITPTWADNVVMWPVI